MMARPKVSTAPKKLMRLVALVDPEEDRRAREIAGKFYGGNVSNMIRALILEKEAETKETVTHE